MTEFFKRIFSWPSFLVFGLGAVVSAIALWLSKKNEVKSLKDALIVQKHRQDAYALKQEIAKLEAEGEQTANQLMFVKISMAEHQRVVVDLMRDIDTNGMPDEEVARLFDGTGL